MSNHSHLTDSYVADLLAKEAADHSLRYSAMGLEAFNSQPKPTNMPKPNTKFLRHIIKDTDNHNRALLAKETAESRARLKDLERSDDAKKRRLDPNTRDIRRRQLGDIQSILGGRKRRSPDDDDDDDDEPSSDSRRSRRRTTRDSGLVSANGEKRREYGRLSRSKDNRKLRRASSHADQRGRSSKARHDNYSSDEGIRRHRYRSQRDRSRSPQRHPPRHRSRSPRESRRRRKQHAPVAEEKEDGKESRDKAAQDDSDPLEDLIGPAPAPTYRGRGTVAGAAGIDQRFSASYDPKTDVRLDEEGDWNEELEAYRDRQKLRQNRESRLRAAGIDEKSLRELGLSGGRPAREKTEEDVVWSKAGVREWDRGKLDDDDYDGDDNDDRLGGIFLEG